MSKDNNFEIISIFKNRSGLGAGEIDYMLSTEKFNKLFNSLLKSNKKAS